MGIFSECFVENVHICKTLSKNINPSLVLVQPRKTRPFITERLLMGRKETNQTNKQTFVRHYLNFIFSKVFVNIKTVLQNCCSQCLY